MRIRLAVLVTAALFLLPAATAAALSSPSPQPEKKCPASMSFVLDHCE